MCHKYVFLQKQTKLEHNLTQINIMTLFKEASFFHDAENANIIDICEKLVSEIGFSSKIRHTSFIFMIFYA